MGESRMIIRDLIQAILELLTFWKKPIKPTIIVQEKLDYKAEIGLRTYTELKQAEGTVEVIIPVQYQNRIRFKRKDEPVGYLGLSEYEATSWIKELRDDGLPVKIPVYMTMSNRVYPSSIKFNYSIDLEANNKRDIVISARPIFLEAKIFDGTSDTNSATSFLNKLSLELTINSEVTIPEDDEHYYKWKKGRKKAPHWKSGGTGNKVEFQNYNQSTKFVHDTVTKFAQDTLDSRQESQNLSNDQKYDKREYPGCFGVIKSLFSKPQKHPSSFLQKMVSSTQYEVGLAFIEIRTPYIRHLIPTWIGQREEGWPSNWRYDAVLDKWRYNPERNSLELRDHILSKKNLTNLYETKLCFDIDPPTEMISDLEGRLILYIDETVSKLEAEWSSEKGLKVESEPPVSYQTWLTMDFVINFEDVFKNREFRAVRQIHFEGISYRPKHIDNIKHILSNHELTVIRDYPNKKSTEEKPQHTIIAFRQAAYEDLILIQIIGKKETGRHTLTYNDKQETLSKRVDLGTQDINVYAWMTKESEEINRLLSSIQMDLEQYFTSSDVINNGVIK